MIISYCVWFFFVLFSFYKDIVWGKKVEFNESNDCVCGTSIDFASRIVGGKETQPHEYPWMVALFYDGKMYCGGSLINDRYVLTAGHCLKWAKKERLLVVLGMHDRILVETERKGALVVGVESFVIHEKFESLKYYDIQDIALVKLKTPVVFNEKIMPVCLPTKTDKTYAGKTVQVTGWGRIGQKSVPSRYLKETHVKVLSNQKCRKAPIVGAFIMDNMLCAYNEETDACQGDSGGPMFYETETGKFEQIGVVSWGMGCALPDIPGVYTRITSHLPWIVKLTKDASYCKIPD